MTYKIKVIGSFNGEITPSGIQEVEAGTSIVFNFAPHIGYLIDTVYVDNQDIGRVSEYQFTNVQADHSIYVRFVNIKEVDDSVAFNRFEVIRGIGYTVVDYLMRNNDDLWRLLKYNTPDALFKDFLTPKEKRALIYEGTGSPDTEQYAVFRQPFMDDAYEKQVTQLRVFVTSLNPQNRSVGTAVVALECVCHNKILALRGYENRLEVMLQQLLQTLNGVEVGGIGQFMFDEHSSFLDIASLNMYNNRNFLGYSLLMSTKIGDLTGTENYDGLFR